MPVLDVQEYEHLSLIMFKFSRIPAHSKLKLWKRQAVEWISDYCVFSRLLVIIIIIIIINYKQSLKKNKMEHLNTFAICQTEFLHEERIYWCELSSMLLALKILLWYEDNVDK